MNFHNANVKLNPRPQGRDYHLQINQSALETLSLIFEFKLATGWHISRFLAQKDYVQYVYLKLRRMWQAGYLESFKVRSGNLVGFPVYYMLSRLGLRVLEEHGLYSKIQLNAYPKPKALFSPHLFEHESQVVELASREAQNKTKDLYISFKGEISSQGQDVKSDKTIEALTPDYTVSYTFTGQTHLVYSELERTAKSKTAQIRKIEKYLDFLSFEQKQIQTLRLIFQTAGMEQSFWLNALTNLPRLHNIRLLTTNVSLLESPDKFLQAIYSSEQTVKLGRFGGRLAADTSQRVKLFNTL